MGGETVVLYQEMVDGRCMLKWISQRLIELQSGWVSWGWGKVLCCYKLPISNPKKKKHIHTEGF